jgi:hydrogenase maturation protein HypF
MAAEVIRRGEILALKGLGGFQLLADATDDDAIRRLRKRKNREGKPLAVMYPDLLTIDKDCVVNRIEKQLLISSASPIVLLHRRVQSTKSGNSIAPSVAPDNPYLGIMLPYTPLHHLLMHELGFPVVATSGNISDEPICIDEYEAVHRLGAIADGFLVHNRPITRQMDDSVVQVFDECEQVLRSARGYAPACISLSTPVKSSLAVGAHQKNSAAIVSERQVFLSQHIGDMDNRQACQAHENAIRSLEGLYDLNPSMAACDLHPDYASTRYAVRKRLKITKVQHHYAHVLSCMADNEINDPVLGVAWDGTGLGTDGTIWGGEFLLVNDNTFIRKAHFRTFCLPGGEKAVIEPRRSALGVLYEAFGYGLFDMKEIESLATFNKNEVTILRQMLARGINCPVTSSMGRMYDAVASLLGICQINAFDGQAAMMLGFAAEGDKTGETYDFGIVDDDKVCCVDWELIIRSILDDIRMTKSASEIAAKFHNTLVEVILTVARRIGEQRIILTGGCFQNRYLTEHTINRLRQEGYLPYWHRRIPPNDGGIAAGQIMALSRINGGHD